MIFMEYISAQEAAKQWGISDRRVRKLVAEGRISGAFKEGKSYKIPAQASKPIDGREKAFTSAKRWLKWGDTTIGTISPSSDVMFIEPNFNEVVSLYTNGKTKWKSEEFIEFLSERVVSRDRRDIERILFRCGLSHYDVLQIAEITRGIHPKDLLWIAHSQDEKLESSMTEVFKTIFFQKIDEAGDSVDTPEGYNVKRYGAHNGNYGIFKQRINPLTTDVESEVAVYLLAQKLGIPCCPAIQVGKDTVFSTFLYDFSAEYIVHFRRLFDGARGENEYQNLLDVRPEFANDIAKMILLDFITRQDDRHLSNIALLINKKGESFYPLYDNGRSLFYEDTEEMVREAVANPALYATSFGISGTYWDYAQEIAAQHDGLSGLINLEIPHDEIACILKQAHFAGYRFDGALAWIEKTLHMLREL